MLPIPSLSILAIRTYLGFLENTPNSFSGGANDVYTFHVQVSGGTPPYTYEWRYNNPATPEDRALANSNVNAGVSTDTFIRTGGMSSQNNTRWYCRVKDSTGTTIDSVKAVFTLA